MSESNVGTYLRTLRYLRARQLAARALRLVARPRPDLRGHPPVRSRLEDTADPVAHAPEWLSPGRVRILNIERDARRDGEPAPEAPSRLWNYHFHYFSDLPGRASDAAGAWLEDVVRSWIEANPPGTGDAWDPYPTSLRIMNWVKWLLRLPESERNKEDVLQSLAVQVRHLERSVEHDILANHIFANAAALCVAGLFFGGLEAERWLTRGLRLVERELREQVLPDGGHYERSPMYHAIVLEQVLDILNVWGGVPDAVCGRLAGVRESLEVAAGRMLTWLSVMVHPDGDFAFFNDTALGVAPTLAQLRSYAARLGVEPAPLDPAHGAFLPESGYYRLTSADGATVVLFDAGPLGPDYQPGHGHCDALSFEVSRGGQRILVNSGVSTYEPGTERLRQRRTAAHNCVLVDGEEQCELWGAHRCGRRHGVLSASASGRSAEGCHSGFAHLPGSPLHHRSVEVSNEGVLVRDGFDGEGEHLIEWFARVHPGLSAKPAAEGFALTRGGRRIATLKFPSEAAPVLEESTWHPGFNLSTPCPLIRASWRGRLPFDLVFELTWD